MAKYECRGKHKVFGKYVWHDVKAKSAKEARLMHWKTFPGANQTFKKFTEIVCRKKR